MSHPTLVGLIMALAACASRPPAAPAEVRLALGETGRAGGLELTFVEVLEDSRCPTGVTCVWAGRARIAVEARPAAGGETVRLELSTESEEAARGAAAGHAIRLVGVDPYPSAGEPIARERYRVTLAVE